MENTIDYSKAPLSIQKDKERIERISELPEWILQHDEERLGKELLLLTMKIDGWEATQKNS